ncbi:MAG: hypothetical protein RLZ77_1561 [Bacteroidota bacterium]|jgi:hypothetical protein
MTRILFFFLVATIGLNAQKKVLPLEDKVNYTMNNPDFEDTLFLDINHHLTPFLGQWSSKHDGYEVEFSIAQYFDKDNHQDALFGCIKVEKDGIVILDTTNYTGPKYITGGIFTNSKDTQTLLMFFSEITEKWVCGHVSEISLTLTHSGTLQWNLNEKYGLSTIRFLPKNLEFKKVI